MPKVDAPTLEYLLGLRSEMEAEYGPQDAQIERSRSVRELRQQVPIPEPLRMIDIEVRDPTMSDETQRVAAMMSINPPSLTVDSFRQGDVGEANATLREHWTEGMLEEAGARVPGQSTRVAVTDGTVGDGGGWSKFLFSRDLWDRRYAIKRKQYPDTKDGTDAYDQATEMAKKASGSPFTWLPVDARSIYPVYQGHGIGEVLEVSQRPVHATFRRYRLGLDVQGNIVPEELGQVKNTDMAKVLTDVTFLEHWDDAWCSYLVVGKNANGDDTGQVVQQWKHGYQRPPYFWAPGLMMNHWRNRKVGWGVSESKRWLVEYRSMLLTLGAIGTYRDLMTSFTRQTLDPAAGLMGDDGRPKQVEYYQPGTIYDIQTGQTMQPIVHAPVADSLKMQLELTSQLIDQLSAPRTNAQLSGLEGAGFAINQVLADSRVRFDPVSQNIERAYSEITQFAWDLVKNKVKEKVWIMGNGDKGFVGIGPDDLKDPVRQTWKIDPERPSDKLIEGRYHTEQVQGGFESRDQAIEAQGRNPDEVRRGQALDRIRQSPEYQKLLDTQVMQEIGRGDLVAIAARAHQLAQTGMDQPPAGMGTQGIPDMGAQAMAPNGAGAQPMGPQNGSVPGAGPGAVVPQRSATPGAQGIVGG